MKNVTFTYNAIEDGVEGEACLTLMLEDDRAAKIKAALEHSNTLHKGEAFTLRHDVNSFCMACERCRGREYVDESIKTVEIEEG